MGFVGAVERAFRADQLVALQAEVYYLLVFMDLAEVGLHTLPLGGLSRALGVDLAGLVARWLEGFEDLFDGLRLVALVVGDGLLLSLGGFALHLPVILRVFCLPAVVLSVDYSHLVG